MTGVHGADAPAQATPALRAHLGLPGATALAITVVVGSGALVLPGIAYQQVGNGAWIAWALAAALTIPMLVVFAQLGAEYPGAGGIAGFVDAGFGRSAAAGVEVMLLGTFGLGIPAIAITGGNYLADLLGLPPSLVGPLSALLLILAAAVVVGGVKLSGRIQTVLALILTIGLLAAATVALANPSKSLNTPSIPDVDAGAVLAAVSVLFFAFTGWEMISFTTEEYRNPRRDFPRVVILSFTVVTVMYLLLALGLQAQARPGDPDLVRTPVGLMVERATSSGGAGQAVALLGVVIIAANLVGAVWGASRLVMSSARQGLLPRSLSAVHAGSSSPRRAVVACLALFTAVVGTWSAGWVELQELLSIAGANFFLLYLACALVYALLHTGARRVFGVLLTAAFVAVSASFGAGVWLYALTLLAVGVGIDRFQRRRSGSKSPSGN